MLGRFFDISAVCLIGVVVVGGSWLEWSGRIEQDGVYTQYGEHEAVVILPGHKLLAADDAVPVLGTDMCPKPEGLISKLFINARDGHQECIVLTSGEALVTVRLGDKSSFATEQWKVQQRDTWKGVEWQLFRPNGQPVSLVAG